MLSGGLIAARAMMPPPPAEPQMKAVLDQLAALHSKPIPMLTPAEARKQPGPTDAVKAILKKKNGGVLPPPEHVGKVENKTLAVSTGNVGVRVYTPDGVGPFPVLVYVHGGGWVIASVDAYDASARTLCNMAKCVVVSVSYRYAPEHKFPAAHEDVYAVLQHVLGHTEDFGGDPKRVAIGGESAGGNMATAACLMARDRKGMMPIYELLVYPVTDTNINTPSYRRNAEAKPLSKPMMAWFFKHTLAGPKDADNKYLAVLRNPNLRGLPPATVITAEIDPLMSEGRAYANRLKSAGVDVRYKNYDGVAHEFFGMGAVIDQAKDAEKFAADGLRSAFEK